MGDIETTPTFQVEKDRFQCVTLNTKDLNSIKDDTFDERLAATLTEWKDKGVRNVSIKVHLQNSSLVPICAKHGFVFHHAQPDYVMMTRWLPTNEPNNFPAYANQYLGSGGLVVNDKGQILVVKERFHVTRHWKFPGGLADPGEDISDAAIREVYEETGIKCEFVSIITFRHQHHFRFNCSDFYFVSLLKPISEEIKACQQEIMECKWMDLDEFIEHPEVSHTNRNIAQRYKYLVDSGVGVSIQAQPLLSFNKKYMTQVYSIGPDMPAE